MFSESSDVGLEKRVTDSTKTGKNTYEKATMILLMEAFIGTLYCEVYGLFRMVFHLKWNGKQNQIMTSK